MFPASVRRQNPMSIGDGTEETVLANFSCRREDLSQLYTALRLSSTWMRKNGGIHPGEWAFLLLLRHLRYVLESAQLPCERHSNDSC